MKCAPLLALLSLACASTVSAPDPDPDPAPDPSPGPEMEMEMESPQADPDPVPDPPPPSETDPTPDPPYTQRPFTATRFVVFYQISGDILADYAERLPFGPGHQVVFTHSHATANASKELADRVHAARSDFLYAPAFDLNSRTGWGTASDDQLRAWATEFRDEALAKNADLFAFNEAPTGTPTRPDLRVAMAKMLRYLAEPDSAGRSLRGVMFLTHAAANPDLYDGPASAFWQAIDDTSVAVVAEHYHSYGFICQNSEAFLADHFFHLRDWLNASGEPAKVSIANRKFIVLHSSRYASEVTGWQGADADVVSLAAFQRDLSKVARITRRTAGGFNRIAWAPVAASLTAGGVHPRIGILGEWHLGAEEADPAELPCIDDADVNCRCE